MIDKDNNNMKFVNLKRLGAYGGTQWYRSNSSLCRNSSVESFSVIMEHYSRIWYDFKSFRIDSFETNLKLSLYNKLSCSIKHIKYFHSYFKYYLNHFAMLQIQITDDRNVPISARLDLYQKVVNYLATCIRSYNNNNSRTDGVKKMNNINLIVAYCYIWNCIYRIIHKRKDVKYGCDCKITSESNILSKDNIIFVIDSNKTCKLLQEYIIDQFIQTNVFGNYFFGYQAPKTEKEPIHLINKCIEYLFYNKLLGDINDYQQLSSDDNNFDSGFCNIIGNRLCYSVFYDLTMCSLNLENEMMFCKLIKLYKFTFNFSVYLHCYSFCKRCCGMSMKQEYYLIQYLNYKDNIFPNIAQLKESNYLDYSYADGSADGTLLHGATDAAFSKMSQVLIEDGFDCQKSNRCQTPLYKVSCFKSLLFFFCAEICWSVYWCKDIWRFFLFVLFLMTCTKTTSD